MTAELCMGLSYILDRAGDGKGAHAWSETGLAPNTLLQKEASEFKARTAAVPRKRNENDEEPLA